jgi:glycosyltransferase involved in cell wall biosynthesis
LKSRVGIVVPTLGERPDYLQKCLRSIRAAGEAHILIIAPSSFDPSSVKSLNLADSVVLDDSKGLPAAINKGIRELPNEVEFVNWLGDDDLLTPHSLQISVSQLDDNQGTLMVFGSCDYIDDSGIVIWVNASGQWTVPLLRFGPDLIPQPGALFRRTAFDAVDGLNDTLGWAFDFDLFIRLSKLGKLKFVDRTLGRFRWHPESLSVEHRKRSVYEASKVRVSHLPSFLRPISFIWEYPVRQATLIAGKRVSAKALSKARSQ